MVIMSMDHYERLKEKFIELVAPSKDAHDLLLYKLLPHFEEIIASKRSVFRLKQSKNLFSLLTILEERDELSPNNVEVLKIMAHLCSCPSAESIVKQYEKIEVTVTKCTICNVALHNEQSKPVMPVLKSLKISYEDESSSEEEEITEIEKAIQKIAPSVGRKWTDVARNLKLQECEIDGIDCEYKRLRDKCFKVFETWRENAGVQATVPRLKKALIKSRRRDLAEMI